MSNVLGPEDDRNELYLPGTPRFLMAANKVQ
jgi:hypothetical protein